MVVPVFDFEVFGIVFLTSAVLESFALERRGAEAPPVADEARRKRGEQRSLPNGRKGKRLLRT